MHRRTPERPIATGEHRRTFTDQDGVFWDVREVRNPDYDRRSGHSLVFESVNAVRRVRTYPPDWVQRSDAELATLSNAK